jgi:hypothetical protein
VAAVRQRVLPGNGRKLFGCTGLCLGCDRAATRIRRNRIRDTCKCTYLGENLKNLHFRSVGIDSMAGKRKQSPESHASNLLMARSDARAPETPVGQPFKPTRPSHTSHHCQRLSSPLPSPRLTTPQSHPRYTAIAPRAHAGDHSAVHTRAQLQDIACSVTQRRWTYVLR